MRILGVCGSLQAESTNRTLLLRAAELAPPGVELEIFEGIGALPLFNPDLEGEAKAPAVQAWRRALVECDAVLFASPEYGFSLPGALKNAIDWVIGTGELEGKLVGVTASAPYVGRGVKGLAALCITLGAVRARIVGGDPIVRGPGFDDELRVLMEALRDRGSRGASPE